MPQAGDFLAEVYGEDGERVKAYLITVEHPDLPEPLRLSTDATVCLDESQPLYGTVSRGNEYWFYTLSIVLPSQAEEEIGPARLVLDAVDQEITQRLLALTDAITVRIEGIFADDPDNVRISLPGLEWREVTGDNWQTISGELRMRDDAVIPYPWQRFSPDLFPGLFRTPETQ